MWTLKIEGNFFNGDVDDVDGAREEYAYISGLQGNVRCMYPWNKLMDIASCGGSHKIEIVPGCPSAQGEIIVKLGGFDVDEMAQKIESLMVSPPETVGAALDALCAIVRH